MDKNKPVTVDPITFDTEPSISGRYSASDITGKDGIFLGQEITCHYDNCVLIGHGITATRDNQVIIGNRELNASGDITEEDMKVIKETLLLIMSPTAWGE